MALTAEEVRVRLIAEMQDYNRKIADSTRLSEQSFDKIGRSVDGLHATMRQAAGGMAAALGTMGLVQLGQQAVETALRFKRFEQGLAIAMGSSAAAGREIGFMRDLADQLGLRFITLAENFTGLAAAARGTALEGQATREVFEAVTKAIVATGGSTEQVNGALLAVQQIMSKGTVSAEELRGQLGERLPGAFQIAARAMGVTTAELGKMLEAGTVASTDFLPRFADQLGRELPSSLQTADAAFQRFQTALDDVANSTADGFMKQLADATDDLTGVLKDLQHSGALEAIGAFLGNVIRLGAGAASVIGDLALSWRRFQLEKGVRLSDNTINGWFSSNEQKDQARQNKARFEAELSRMNNPGRKGVGQSSLESLEQYMARGAERAGGGSPAGSGGGTRPRPTQRRAGGAGRTGPSAEDIARREEQELSRLRIEEMSARMRLTENAQERAELARDILSEERTQRIAEIAAAKNLSEAQKRARMAYIDSLYGKDALVGPSGEMTVHGRPGLLKEVVNSELEKEMKRAQEENLRYELDALNAQRDVARSRQDRLAIDQTILDLLERQERSELDAAIAAGRIADATKARADQAAAQAGRRQKTLEEGASPLSRYSSELDLSPGQISDRVEELVVDQLQSVQDGIAGALTKRLGIKDPLLAGIIDLFIEQTIMRPLAEALSGAGGGGLFGSIFGAIGLPGFAGGGSMTLGGRGGADRNTLSLNGRPIANVSRGETLNVGSKALRPGGGGAGERVFNIHVDARNSVTPAGFAQELSRNILGQAAQMDGQMGRSVLRAVPSTLNHSQRFGTNKV